MWQSQKASLNHHVPNHWGARRPGAEPSHLLFNWPGASVKLSKCSNVLWWMVFWGVAQSWLETRASISFSGSAWTRKPEDVDVAKRNSFQWALIGDSDAFLEPCSSRLLVRLGCLRSAEFSHRSDHEIGVIGVSWNSKTVQCEMFESLREHRVPVWCLEAGVRMGGPARHHTLVLIAFVQRMLVFEWRWWLACCFRAGSSLAAGVEAF